MTTSATPSQGVQVTAKLPDGSQVDAWCRLCPVSGTLWFHAGTGRRIPTPSEWQKKPPRPFQAPGILVSGREVELRVLRAIKTIDAQPNAMPRGYHGITFWPEFYQEYHEVKVARFKPNPSDLEDILEPLAWFSQLAVAPSRHNPDAEWRTPPKNKTLCYEQRLIAMRARDLSFKAIADIVGGAHHSTFKRHYDGAIAETTGIAQRMGACGNPERIGELEKSLSEREG